MTMEEASHLRAGVRIPKLDLGAVDVGSSLQQALGRADAVLAELKNLRVCCGAVHTRTPPLSC